MSDEDGATPNLQWTDLSGDPSPTGFGYYDTAAYNGFFPTEGPRQGEGSIARSAAGGLRPTVDSTAETCAFP